MSTPLPNSPEGCQPGSLITCRADELRPHPSYERHHIAVSASQLSSLAELGDLVFREPLVITRSRTILDGYARWMLAQQQRRLTLQCIEYDLPEAEALHWLLQKHRRSNGLNAFSLIVLALELEPWLKEQARLNQRTGGQNRGSSKLSEADRLDVRARIAAAAGAAAGNVSKVKHLLSVAKPAILQALREGEVSIHRASLWLQTPRRNSTSSGGTRIFAASPELSAHSSDGIASPRSPEMANSIFTGSGAH